MRRPGVFSFSGGSLPGRSPYLSQQLHNHMLWPGARPLRGEQDPLYDDNAAFAQQAAKVGAAEGVLLCDVQLGGCGFAGVGSQATIGQPI